MKQEAASAASSLLTGKTAATTLIEKVNKIFLHRDIKKKCNGNMYHQKRNYLATDSCSIRSNVRWHVMSLVTALVFFFLVRCGY
jgi:hypothetical protein